jgi:hypothetical protein
LLLSSQDCVGAIDGTHVTARVLKSQLATYRGRKHYISHNVLVVVDFDLKFTYMLAGWKGSGHDASIPTDSLSKPDGIHLPFIIKRMRLALGLVQGIGFLIHL